MIDKTGRNDPCPCGSGKKYKKCCLEKETPAAPGGPATVFDEVREMLAGREFKTITEANAFLQWNMAQRNRAPLDKFDGLSPEQVNRFLYHPFDSPQLVTFPAVLAREPSAPIAQLFTLLVDAIGEKGLKPTATGNLPRNICRDAALAFLGEDGYRERTRFSGINSETDFYELNVTRLVAELAGLVRKYKGDFILSRSCREILRKDGMAGMYPRLLKAFIHDFNWGYGDRYPEIPMVQHAFLFTLYLLNRHGDEWRAKEFYEERFVQAFPQLLNEMPDDPYYPAEKSLRSCFSLRSLQRFAEFLGVVEIERVGPQYMPTEVRLRKLPLLDESVQFKI